MIIPVITHFGTAQILFQGMHFMPFVLTECTGLCSGSAPSLHWFCCAGRTLQLLSNLQPQEEEEEDLDFPFQGDFEPSLPRESLHCLHLPVASKGGLCFQVCCARLGGTTYPWAKGKQPLDLLPCAPSVCTHHQCSLKHSLRCWRCCS